MSLCHALASDTLLKLVSLSNCEPLRSNAVAQSDLIRLIQNICRANPPFCARLTKHLQNGESSQTMLRSLLSFSSDTVTVFLLRGDSFFDESCFPLIPEAWIDVQHQYIASKGIALTVPAHLTLAEVVSILFSKFDKTPRQSVSCSTKGNLMIDNREHMLGEIVAIFNAESQETMTGQLWAVSQNEFWLELQSGMLKLVSFSSLRSGANIKVIEEDKYFSLMQDRQIGSLGPTRVVSLRIDAYITKGIIDV